MPRKREDHRSARGITISFTVLIRLGIAVIVAAGGVAVWYFLIRSTTVPAPAASSQASTKTLYFSYPRDWSVVSARAVHGVPADAVIVLQQKSKSGLFVVLPSGRAPALDTKTATMISTELEKKFADYKFISARVVPLKAGKALVITYLRTKQNVLHTITILPVGQRSFVIDTASPPSNGQLGTEIGRILESARLSKKT